MKPPILVGLALIVLFVAVGLIAPSLRSSSAKLADQAQEQAALARRELARYSPTLPLAAELAGTADLKKHAADLAPAVAAAGDPLKQAAAEYTKLTRTAQDLAHKRGLPAPTFPPYQGDAAGAQKALDAFESAAKANDALLAAAAKHAQAAQSTDPMAIGVAQTVGMTAYAQAAGLLDAADELRMQQADILAKLLDQGSQRNMARGFLSHYRSLDTTKLLAQLRSDLEEIDRLRQAAVEARVALASQVDEQSRRLDQVAEELKQATAERLTLEQRGFVAGNDQSFDDFKNKFMQILARARQLQADEQELRFGGLQGSELVGDDPATAELRGGQPVSGLEELQRRLATAVERAKRLENAHVSLDDQLKRLTDQGQDAQSAATRYEQRLTELEGAEKTTVEELKKVAADAFGKEDEALAAAKKAIQAFGQAQRSADTWLRTVRELQSTKDPSRKNERLRLILQDPYFEQSGRSAEAAAQVLAGRIYNQRVAHTAALVGQMQVFAQLEPDFEFDAAPFQAQLDTARTEGQTLLEKAAETYGKMADKQSPTMWIPQAALAATFYQLSLLDDSQAELYRGKAEEAIAKAVEKTEKSPYVKPYLQFRDTLAATKAPPPTPEAKPGETTEPTEEEDFFLRED